MFCKSRSTIEKWLAVGVTYVFDAKPEFTLLAENQFESDQSGFNSTPAVSDGELFIRSNTYLYCVSAN